MPVDPSSIAIGQAESANRGEVVFSTPTQNVMPSTAAGNNPAGGRRMSLQYFEADPFLEVTFH